MDREQEPQPDAQPVWPPLNESGQLPVQQSSYWAAPSGPKPSRGTHLRRIGVGAIVSFLAVAIGYGPQNAVMLVGLAVICTAGVGLIPLAFLSWIVGWIVIAVWQAIAKTRQGASPTP